VSPFRHGTTPLRPAGTEGTANISNKYAVADGADDFFLYLRYYFEASIPSILQTVAQDLKFARFLLKSLRIKVCKLD
jgi:hypothetical protein